MQQKIKQYCDRHTTSIWCLSITPFIIYLIFSCLYFAPANLTQLGTHLFSNGGDPQQFVWLYNWWPYSLTHHLNPFITRYTWYPLGYNLSWATSIAGLSLIMLPVTLLGSALLSFNLMALLAPVLGATACFYLLYYLTKKFIPALLGGYVYGFSSFNLGHLLGHPQMYADFLLPIIALLFMLYFDRRIRKWPYIILTSALLALQFSISEEIFATFWFFSIVTMILFYWLSPQIRRQLIAGAKALLFIIPLVLLLIIPYIYNMILSRHEVPAIIHPISPFSINLANYFIPTQITWLGGNALVGLTHYFTGNISENGAYIGLPFLLILAIITLKYWQVKPFRTLIVAIGTLMLLALGPRLHLAGQAGSSIPLPWALFERLPLFNSAQPDRFTVYIFLLLAIILALWLSQPKDRIAWSYKYLAVLVGIVFIIPNIGMYTWSRVQVPVYFHRSVLQHHLRQNSNVLILPFEKLGSSVYYQYYSGMYFTQTGAYVGFMPQQYVDNPVVTALMYDTVNAMFPNQLKQFCLQHHIQQIIYTPSTPANQVKALAVTGWPISHEYGVAVVHVPRTF